MNIFYVHTDPVIAAKSLCDKHVVKMILETAQLLSAAHHIYNTGIDCYKLTHRNHPSSVWVRESSEHYDWALMHFTALCSEYTHRYKKTHATQRLAIGLGLNPVPVVRSLVPPPQCMYAECRESDTVQAYRKYYNVRRGEITMRWTNREIPSWM
jgi:hypothetical protein